MIPNMLVVCSYEGSVAILLRLATIVPIPTLRLLALSYANRKQTCDVHFTVARACMTHFVLLKQSSFRPRPDPQSFRECPFSHASLPRV
jgi:hypothetical protein